MRRRTSSMLRTSGKDLGLGMERVLNVGQSRGTVCVKKKRMPLAAVFSELGE